MLEVGSLVCHQATREEGRILRVVKTSDVVPAKVFHQQSDTTAYVVLIMTGALRPSREVLWYASEIAGAQQSEEVSAIVSPATTVESRSGWSEADLSLLPGDPGKSPHSKR